MASDLTEMTVAADIGGTHMRAALVSRDGEILFRQVLPTPHHDRVPDELTALILSAAHHEVPGYLPATQVVVGLPGQIDYRSGRLLWAPHLPASWPDQLSAGVLKTALGLPVHLANDADVAAVGEAYFGSGQGHRDVAYVTISTGIGAGLVFDGRLLAGDRSIAELGHTIIDWKEWRAGQPSVLEEMASGTGMTRLAEAAGLTALTSERILQLVDDGDQAAKEVFAHATWAGAAGVRNVAMLFSPDVIVVGGGLGLQQQFLSGVQAILEAHVTPQTPMVPLMGAKLGDSAGLVGAARWVAATA